MKNLVLQPKFIKPFSKGQITLPKNYRDFLGIDEKSWLKISLQGEQILLQPVKEERTIAKNPLIIKPKTSFKNYLKILSKAKGAFGPELEEENKTIRKEVEERLRKVQF